MFPGTTTNRNEGACAYSLVPETGTRAALLCLVWEIARFLGSAMGIAIANRKNRCDFGALSCVFSTQRSSFEVPEKIGNGP